MSYATPALFIQRYGLEETVQLLADEQRLLTGALLKQAIAAVWEPATTAEEQAAASDALARLTRQLQICSSTMDGYLAAVMTLPVPPENANASVLEECCLALTRCGIADDTDNATDRADKACDTWRTWLRDVATGKLTLGVQAPDGTTVASGRVRTGQAVSGIDWTRYGGVR